MKSIIELIKTKTVMQDLFEKKKLFRDMKMKGKFNHHKAIKGIDEKFAEIKINPNTLTAAVGIKV